MKKNRLMKYNQTEIGNALHELLVIFQEIALEAEKKIQTSLDK